MNRLHHVAVGAQDVERVAGFYREVFGLSEAARHHDERGALRSIWLDLGGSVLMFERTAEPRRSVSGVGCGPFLIALSVSVEGRTRLELSLERRGHVIDERTAFTSYTRDPEGNRVAFSHYPEPALGQS